MDSNLPAPIVGLAADVLHMRLQLRNDFVRIVRLLRGQIGVMEDPIQLLPMFALGP